MAKTDTVEILLDEVTLHQETQKLTNAAGEQVGSQLGLGKTYYRTEKVAVSDIAPIYLEALDDEDHPSHESISKRIKRSTGDPEQDTALRLGLPFVGYEDLDEDGVMALLPNLPSETQQRVKEWEKKRDEPRERIVTFNSGFGESPLDRQEGKVNSGTTEDDEDPDKAVRGIKTRSVPEEGPVESGEGITGTGEPSSEPGSAQAEEEGGSPSPKRRSRRTRPKVAARKPSPTEGGGGDNE